MKYAYSFYENEDRWAEDTYTSITDALEKARDESDGYYDAVYIGEVHLCDPKLGADDVVDVLEMLRQRVCDECGDAEEVWEPYDYEEKWELEELASLLNAEIAEWMERHGHEPVCYVVRNINEYLL